MICMGSLAISQSIWNLCPLMSIVASYYYLLQTQDLRVNQEKEPCIGLTQENSIGNSVQDSLPLYTLDPWSVLAISTLP